MSQNFVACDRDQELCLPPSLRDWLPGNHFVWFLLDTVEQLDLSVIYARYRADGRGRPAYEPRMMVALLLFAYTDGVLSSRDIERGCERDVAYRVITANRAPDHTTVSRFRSEHAPVLAGLFEQVLALCQKAGMLKVGRVALDGTKMAGNASLGANRRYPAIRKEIERLLEEADAVDAAEDRQLGSERGDELPEELADPRSRRARLERAKRELEAEEQARQEAYQKKLERREEHRERTGRYPAGRPPKQPDPEQFEHSKRNITDPESRIMSARGAHIQGYNAQAVVDEGQLILAAEVTNVAADNGQLEPMLTAAQHNLDAIAHQHPIKCALADAGYWNQQAIAAVRQRKIVVVVPTSDPHYTNRHIAPRQGPEADRINKMLATDAGKRLYRRRAALVEPVFAHTKHRRGITRFSRRGLTPVNHEWKLIAATHNLLKLYRHRPEPA